MENIENENLKLFCYDCYVLDFKIKWDLAPMGKTRYEFYGETPRIQKEEFTLFKTKFYNPNNKNKIHHMRIYLLFQKETGDIKLYIKGNLSEWYYQVPLGRKLSSEEYSKCLKFLLYEFGLKKEKDTEEFDKEGISDDFDNMLSCIKRHKEYKSKKKGKTRE